MESQKHILSPLEIGEIVHPTNCIVKDVCLSLNLNKIQRDHSTGKGFNGTLKLINQLENIVNKPLKNQANILEIRRSSLLRSSNQLPSSRSQRSSSQIQLKQIPLPSNISHTPSMCHAFMSKRSRCSSNIPNNQNPNNSSSNKENMAQNSHRLSTFENSLIAADTKSINQPLNSARTSLNLPQSSSQAHSSCNNNSNGNNNTSVSRSILRKYSKQIKSIQNESNHVNSLYKKGHDQKQLDLQNQFEKQCNGNSNSNNHNHPNLPLSQLNFQAVAKEINEYIQARSKSLILYEDQCQKKFFDNAILLLNMFENYSQKSQKINEHIKNVLNEVFTSLTSSFNKGPVGQMQLSQSYQKIKRCIQTMSQNGLGQLFPFYNASVIDICEFQNKVLLKIFSQNQQFNLDENAEQAIIMKKAQENRKQMDLLEKLEELKIENELYKKQKIQLEQAFNSTLEKQKKENKEIQKQNRDLSKENMKLRLQLDNLQKEIEMQSNLNNTKTNYQNMSYFDSINNTAIADEKRTLEQNFFTGSLPNLNQQFYQFNPVAQEYDQLWYLPYETKFWIQINQFNSQLLNQDKFFNQKEVNFMIQNCIDNHLNEEETSFRFTDSLLKYFKKGCDSFEAMKKLIQFQKSFHQINCLHQIFYRIFNIQYDENQNLIQELLLLEQSQSFTQSIKQHSSTYQNAYVKIYKILLEESSKNKIQRQSSIQLNLLIVIIKKIFEDSDDYDWQWRVSLPLLLSKSEMKFSGEVQKDQQQFLMLLHGYLLNRFKLDQQDPTFQMSNLTLKEFSSLFNDISDICSERIQNKFQEQIYFNQSQINNLYESINEKQRNKKQLMKIGIDISQQLQKCSLSIIEATSIVLSLIYQKLCMTWSSLKNVKSCNKCQYIKFYMFFQQNQVQNFFEESNRIYELNKILQNIGLNLEQYEIYDSIAKIQCSCQDIKSQQEQIDFRMYLQKRDFSSDEKEIAKLIENHLANIIINHLIYRIGKAEYPSTFQSVNSIKAPSISIAHYSNKLSEMDQDSILALTQPSKIISHINNQDFKKI
ncbi:hypothetical protein ABPG72_005182 [Tetrahymena utriculariae]